MFLWRPALNLPDTQLLPCHNLKLHGGLTRGSSVILVMLLGVQSERK